MLRNEKGKCFNVNKSYEISGVILGRGSFSTVYLARHSEFGNKVALKVIDRNDIKEEYVAKNLHREAKILMKLNHPNIVKFYEEVSAKELYCLSMEYIVGVNLSQYLKRQEHFRVSERTAKTLFYQMASAVDHMHYNNILHRDLKQENILLEHEKVIKIVDFGLSNIYQPQLKLRTHCGSIIYAAPELFQNRSVYGTGVDLWSLGVILYAMLTGRMPFEISKTDGGSSTSSRKRNLFYKRISQGLLQENFTDMQMLSMDCCDLLNNLLQPDQFRRMHIQAVLLHPWFHKDRDLRRRLPRQRSDLKNKLTPEIMEFMAVKMNVSIQRVQNHIRSYKFDYISAIFNILLDTLMKEILHPPKVLEETFLLRFEKWRKGLDTDGSLSDEDCALKNVLRKGASSSKQTELNNGRSAIAKKQSFINRAFQMNSESKKIEAKPSNVRHPPLYDNAIQNPANSRRHLEFSGIPKRSADVKQLFKNVPNIATKNVQIDDTTVKFQIKQRPLDSRPVLNRTTHQDCKQRIVERQSCIRHKDQCGSMKRENDKIRQRVGDGSSDFKLDDPCVKEQLVDKKDSDCKTLNDNVASIKSCVSSNKKQPIKSYRNSRPCNVKSKINPEIRKNSRSSFENKCDLAKTSDSSLKATLPHYRLNKAGVDNNFEVKNKIVKTTVDKSDINKASKMDLQENLKQNSLISSSKLCVPSKVKRPPSDNFLKTNLYAHVPPSRQVYLQRDILISRADRGCGKIFFNSNIFPRSFRSNAPSVNGQRSQFTATHHG